MTRTSGRAGLRYVHLLRKFKLALKVSLVPPLFDSFLIDVHFYAEKFSVHACAPFFTIRIQNKFKNNPTQRESHRRHFLFIFSIKMLLIPRKCCFFLHLRIGTFLLALLEISLFSIVFLAALSAWHRFREVEASMLDEVRQTYWESKGFNPQGEGRCV